MAIEKITKYLYEVSDNGILKNTIDIRQVALVQSDGCSLVLMCNIWVGLSAEDLEVMRIEWINHHRKLYKEKPKGRGGVNT